MKLTTHQREVINLMRSEAAEGRHGMASAISKEPTWVALWRMGLVVRCGSCYYLTKEGERVAQLPPNTDQWTAALPT